MSERSYRWMLDLLDELAQGWTRDEALTLLRDGQAQAAARDALAPRLEERGMPAGMLASDEGGNLFVAVLALRLKFPLDEARRKVELNIAMREGRA